MQYAIVMVVMPTENHEGRQTWQYFCAKIAKPLSNPAVEELAMNMWQVNFQHSPAALSQLVAAADEFGFAYRVLPFDGEPQWIRVNPTKPVK